MALALMAKVFKLNYSTPTNNNQRISSNPRNRQIAQPGMNMGQDRQMQMVGGNCGNQFRQYAGQNVGNLNGYNDVQNVRNQVIQNAIQNPRIQNVRNQNGLIVVPGNANQNPNRNGNLAAARAEGNATGHNGNQIRCYNCRGVADLDEIEEVNANCILMANLQQALTSGTQTDIAPVYDSDGSVEVHDYENCYDNEIFNMFTQEEQYTELLESIPEPHQVPQNDNNVISEVFSVEQSEGTVEQHPANVEETCVLYDTLYNNLAIEVEKVNTVNRKLSETNAELTTELEMSDLNKQLSVEKSTVSSLLEEKKKLKYDLKIREDELLDIQIQLEKKIKELDNILVKTVQSIQTIHMLSPKPDSFYHTEQKMALGSKILFISSKLSRNNRVYITNLQQASTSGAQTDKAPVYDSDGSAEVHNYENCYDNEIFNMFTQEEQSTELLEPIPEPHQVPQNDNNVISEDSSVEQSGGTVEQHPANVKETRVLYNSLYNNLAIEVKKVNTVNRKLKETNAELTTELARFKNQEKCFEISQEKYDKLERCYQKSVYQEQCLSKKINALHLSSGKQIMTLNEEISDLNKQLSMEKSIVSSLLEEKKNLKSDFKIRKDELLDKQIQLEKKIKELDNILSLYDGKVLLEKHDPPVVHDLEETLLKIIV
nr:hypothetical protein [Tanacetum cinerariifolium]